MSDEALAHGIEQRVERLGFEFVELERAGSRSRPILRVKIDRPDSTPGHGVTLEDCSRVSRELESWLDTEQRLSERYVLEVSSPGVERPLLRSRDYVRFRGQTVVVLAYEPPDGKARRFEGVLLGLTGSETEEAVVLHLDDGREAEIPLRDIARAHLIFNWPGR